MYGSEVGVTRQFLELYVLIEVIKDKKSWELRAEKYEEADVISELSRYNDFLA